jgi:hypothetical protein
MPLVFIERSPLPESVAASPGTDLYRKPVNPNQIGPDLVRQPDSLLEALLVLIAEFHGLVPNGSHFTMAMIASPSNRTYRSYWNVSKIRAKYGFEGSLKL